MKRLDDQVLDKIKSHMDELPPRQNLRPYDIVAELADRYSGTRDRGYNLDDFVSVLEQHGIQLTRNTVRNYLSRARAALRGTAPGPRLRRARDDVPRKLTQPVAEAAVRVRDERSAAAAPGDSLADTPLQDSAPTAGTTEPKPSVLERARAHARESSSSNGLPTPGSFRIRPDTKDL